MMIAEIEGKCQYKGCHRKATHIASSEEGPSVRAREKAKCYCRIHAEVVARCFHPEYLACCPNCSCMFGVN